MVTETSVEFEEQVFSEEMDDLNRQYEDAQGHLRELVDSATASKAIHDDTLPLYSLHEVKGIGRYAVVRKTGWRPLLKTIRTMAANIDFSANTYPNFDGIIGKHFASPYLLDPLNEKYESYRDLRDNIAAVRNFLMETYYTDKIDTPGMTPEKAEKAMKEIAALIGDGLDNNNLVFGFIRKHDSSKFHISIDKASETGGRGAQYIYERILEKERHSNWMRPFSAVSALFGGKPAPEWMLPPAHKTGFTDFIETDIAERRKDQGPNPKEIQTEIDHVNMLEAARTQRLDQYKVNLTARDLDTLGTQLFETVNSLQTVQQLSEPVRHDAIEIAKDILKKLKFTLGNLNVITGMKLPPMDDVAAFGGLKGVAGVYERMVQWARGVDPRITQDPAVIAATQAIGQLGYLAKVEALRMAKVASNQKLEDSLFDQLAKVPAVYTSVNIKDKTFGQLLDTVEVGMNTIMNRVQTMSGPGSQFGLATNSLGGNVTAAPTAGLGMQANLLGRTQMDNAAKQHAALATQQHAQQVRTQTQQSVHSHTETRSGTAVAPSRAPTGRPAATQARAHQRAVSSTTNPLTPVNPAQRPPSMRMNTLHSHEHELEEHEHQQLLLKQQQLLEMQHKAALATQQKAAAKAVAKKIDPNLLAKLGKGMNTHGMTGTAVNPGGEHKPHHVIIEKHDNTVKAGDPLRDPNQPYLPQGPAKGGRSL